MWLNNTDKEVECFHPVCQMALRGLNLCEKYEVQHHRHVGSIEMDFVIANKASNRILCVIEVKRTIASVNSTRYQYQAMSYVQALSEQQLESKYYLLTNLEASCLFKFDRDRPNVYEQIVEPGICINHRFAEVSKDVFISDLSKQYTRFLTTIIQDQGHYLLSFARFAAEFQNECAFGLAWKTKLVGLFYEYIRGAFTTLKRKELKTIPQLSRRADLICKEGLKVNFVDIFNLKNLSPQEKITTDRNLLQQLFDLGKTYIDADELANVMHKVVANEHEGEVSTDIELANLMLQIVKHYIGTLSSKDKIMDPAAGSGSLLCASTNVFDGLQPCQLVANDINERFLQLLSLRLGLKFAHTIKPDHSAHISSLDIADMPARQFDDVRVIVMNPPYLSAVSPQCATRKAKLFDRIRHHKGGHDKYWPNAT